jgi:general secretion pathway protein D
VQNQQTTQGKNVVHKPVEKKTPAGTTQQQGSLTRQTSPAPTPQRQQIADPTGSPQAPIPGSGIQAPENTLEDTKKPRTSTSSQTRTTANPASQQELEASGGKTGQFITMDFDGVDIRVFIKFIADITGKNFIIDDKVSGKITVISPRKMNLDEAYRVFLSVLEVNGFGSVEMGGVTKIVRASDAITKSLETTMGPQLLKDDTLITQIIPLKYADANDMKNLLSPLMSKASSQLLSYPQSNILIVTDSRSNIKKLMDILKVVDVAGFAQEVRIFPLAYASAADLASKLSDILTEGKQDELQRLRAVRQPEAMGGRISTKIIPYERTNSLIVLAPPPDVAGIGELITKLDIPTPTGKEDIHVYYLQHANAEDMAKVLTEMPTPASPGEAQAQAPGYQQPGQPGQPVRARTVANPALKEQNIKISPDKETNSLIIYADPYQYKSLLETIKYLDIPRKQVYVKALIMEVNTSRDFKVGVEWTYFNDFKYDHDRKTGGILARTGENFITSPSDLPSGALLGVIGQTITINKGGTEITFPSFTSFINAMSTDSDVNIISTPQILTMDNKEAEIKVGKNVPYLTRQDTDTTNINRTVNSFDYRDVGVTLKLTPQINQQGNIRMAIFEETTTLVAGTGEQAFAPTTLKRSATTTVSVKDGSTMVIGGLIGDTLTLGNDRVPLLGDIPILGYLFKSISKNREKTTLYIFLSPQIIDTDQKVETLYQEKSRESDEALNPKKKAKGNEKSKP